MNMMMIGGLVMLAFGVVLGAAIGLAARFFRVQRDARIDLVVELLPGANCGGCGRAGCADFASAVVAGEMPPSACPVNSRANASEIARVLGVELGEGFARRAVILCGGGRSQTTVTTIYNGVTDCVSASLVAGGAKECRYGCMGLASCARACPFGAIEVVNNLAVVHAELCVGCGKCVATCPRKLIKLVPADATVHVYCNSPEKAPVKKRSCAVPCIGCRKCVKNAEGKFVMGSGFCASANYQSAPYATEEDIERIGCPTGALLSAAKHLEIERTEPDWSMERNG